MICYQCNIPSYSLLKSEEPTSSFDVWLNTENHLDNRISIVRWYFSMYLWHWIQLGIAWYRYDIMHHVHQLRVNLSARLDVPKCKRTYLEPGISSQETNILANRNEEMLRNIYYTMYNNKIPHIVSCEYEFYDAQRTERCTDERSSRSLQNNDGCIKMKYYTLTILYGFKCK